MSKLFVVAKTLIINSKGEVLILRRSPWPEHPERSHQADFPGGLVEKRESPALAATRETEEETGIEISPDRIVLGYTKTFYDDADNESHTKFLYIARLDHIPEIKLSWEHDGYEWTLAADLLSMHTFGSFYAEGIEYLQSHKII